MALAPCAGPHERRSNQFRPSGAALYARPSGMRAGVSVHRHGTSGAVSRSIQITRRGPRAGYSPGGSGHPAAWCNPRSAIQGPSSMRQKLTGFAFRTCPRSAAGF